MFNFCIILIEPAMNLTLGFKEKDMANAARVAMRKNMDAYKLEDTDSRMTVKDDYGHEIDVYASNVSGVLIQDHQASVERANDQNIDTARANADFLARRNEDMELMRLFPGNQVATPHMGRA